MQAAATCCLVMHICLSKLSLVKGSILESKPEKISHHQCRRWYGNRQFLSRTDARTPPMLYTFPGSGNHWLQLLIEYATGYHTGSVYREELTYLMPGMAHCSQRVALVKLHAVNYLPGLIRRGNFSSKCQQGGIETFHQAIFLIRDPFDAIWASYQGKTTNSHNGRLPPGEFNFTVWEESAIAQAKWYFRMVAESYKLIEYYLGSEQVLYVRYEDLMNRITRYDTLVRIVEFLQLPEVSTNNSDKDGNNYNRLECAFKLADHPKIHRPADSTLEAVSTVSKQQVYAAATLVCRIWSEVKLGEVVSVPPYSYSIWNGTICPQDAHSGDGIRSSAHAWQLVGGRNKSELATCRQKYGAHRFISMSIIQKFPLRYTPFLYTFPGSGGSWLQSVIEHATGVNTGSIGCPGERSTRRNGFCSRRVSLVKLHANLWSHIKLSQGNFSDECVAEGVYSFNRAVLLIRDPFEVIWAATRHIVNSLVKSNNNGSYNTVIPSVQLSAWWSEARGTAERFARMVDTQYAWVRRVLAERDVLVVRYEDLSDGNVNNRKELITQVINFLQLPNSAINPPNTSRSEQVSLDQLACSLLLADYSDPPPRDSLYENELKHQLYSREVVCGIWAILGEAVSTEPYSYNRHRGTNCTGVLQHS